MDVKECNRWAALLEGSRVLVAGVGDRTKKGQLQNRQNDIFKGSHCRPGRGPKCRDA